MCDFRDMSGNVISPGDTIEYWSSSYKDWLRCRVGSIHLLSYADDKRDFYIKVNRLNAGGRVTGNNQKLTKPDNIRKVF